MEKPLFRRTVGDPRNSVSCAAVTLQGGFTPFAVTTPQVALRKTLRRLRAGGGDSRRPAGAYNYSSRSATNGSILNARAAGTYDASVAAIAKPVTTAPYAYGSSVVTPNSMPSR